MKKSIEIKSEIDKTDSRITELETQLTEQTATFEGVQQAFIAGKADSDELHAEQGKMTLLAQGLESLKAMFERLKSAFERQSAEERRGELLRQMATTANEVEPLVDDYLKTRNEFHELIKKYAENLFSNAETYRSKQLEYRAIVAELKPTDEEIQASGLDQKTRTMASATYFNHPSAGFFTEAVALAENLLAAKLHKEASQRRIASAKARQAAN